MNKFKIGDRVIYSNVDGKLPKGVGNLNSKYHNSKFVIVDIIPPITTINNFGTGYLGDLIYKVRIMGCDDHIFMSEDELKLDIEYIREEKLKQLLG